MQPQPEIGQYEWPDVPGEIDMACDGLWAWLAWFWREDGTLVAKAVKTVTVFG